MNSPTSLPQLSFPPPVREAERSYSASPSRFSFSSRSVSRGRRRDDSVGSSLDRSLSRSRLLGSRMIPQKDIERQEESKFAEFKTEGVEKEPKVKGPRLPFVSKFPPLIAHFLGYRPVPSRYDSPILPFLAMLSPQTETYLLSALGSFCAILSIIAVSVALSNTNYGNGAIPLTFASLGATAVLIFGVPDSPLSQPRNVIVSNIVAAVIGVSLTMLFQLSSHYALSSSSSPISFEGLVPVVAALAMSLSLLASQLGKFVHPPSGALAIIIVTIPNAAGQHYGILLLVLLALLAMTFVGLVFGNLGRRSYPKYWISPPLPAPAPIILPPVQLSMSPVEEPLSSFSHTLDPPPNDSRIPLRDVDEGDEESEVTINGEGRGRTDERRRGYTSRPS